MDESIRPLPTFTQDHAPFWHACKSGRLELPHCTAWQQASLPAAPVCPVCFGDRVQWRTASGLGTVSSWVVVHQPWFPSFAADIPYNVVQVELDEGPRLTTSVVGVNNDPLQIGMRVQVEFDHVSEAIALPRFRPL